MRVFVTGGTGFIGKHLVRRLAREGHSVRCLVRPASRSILAQQPGIEAVVGDVNDRDSLLRGMAGCDWVFHLANLYSMWEADRGRYARVNVEGTRQVFSAAVKCGVQKVVYVSTVAVYGKPAQSPFDENDAPGPEVFSEYARTKAAAERFAWEFSARHGLPLVVLYPGIVLGAGDDKASGRYIQDIIRRRVPSTIFHDAWATYVYVGDVVEALLRAAENPQAAGQKYLIGGYSLTGRQYAALIERVSGVPLPWLRLPDWMVTCAAYLLTGLSAVTKREPLWGLTVDAARTLRCGFRINGQKAVHELGLQYTDIAVALDEAVAWYRQQWRKPKPPARRG